MNPEKVTVLFDYIVQPPKHVKLSMIEYVPDWALSALFDDVLKSVEMYGDELDTLKVSIQNAHTLLRREVTMIPSWLIKYLLRICLSGEPAAGANIKSMIAGMIRLEEEEKEVDIKCDSQNRVNDHRYNA